jgi:hypothetical protein
MKPLLHLALGAALCVLLSSCVPTSENPLSPASSARADKALVGDWLDKNDQEIYRITVKKGPWMHVDIFIKSGTKTDSYDFFSTTIGTNKFANVVISGKDEHGRPIQAYTFIRYVIFGKQVLKMSSMSPHETAISVRAGLLKGAVHEDKNSSNPDVSLADTSEKLAKFIQGADATKLFTNEETLVRIK